MNTQTITLAQLATACQNAAYINVHLYTPAMSSLSTFKPDQIRFMSASTGVPLLRLQSKPAPSSCRLSAFRPPLPPAPPATRFLLAVVPTPTPPMISFWMV